MKRPLFSVLIPSRNRPELLRYAVDSVLSQDADLEIVIADNASGESYSEYVSSLGAIAAGSVRSDQPLPVTENWNRALAAASGRYIIMMGDDDALAPGWLSKATVLLQQFNQPDAVHAMAYHYAYPGVVPSKPAGYLATVNNSELFRAFDRPYLLARERAVMLGTQALHFRHWFSFNSQHFIWNMQFIDSLHAIGNFFQGPYPDYYAAIVTMYAAKNIVVVPTPEVIIGISPKSFGFFYNNKRYDAGQQMLGNTDADCCWLQELSDEAKSAVAFPGAAHYRNWLLVALLVARNFILPQTIAVDLRRYRQLQILEVISGHDDQARSAVDRINILEPHLGQAEIRFLRQLDLQDVIQYFVGAVGGIYTPALVTEHDIGEHTSIVDACRWLASDKHPGAAENKYLAEAEYSSRIEYPVGAEEPSFSFAGPPPLQGKSAPCASGTYASQEALADMHLPVLHPLPATAEGITIAVVYLARSADGSVRDFGPFVESYKAHDAGLPHDLIIVRKGLHQRLGSQFALSAMLDGLPHRAVDVSDEGFDIQAYLKVTPYLRHDRVCFLNTFSEIKADDWLRSLNAPLDRPEVGMTGATASYESLFTSLYMLSKVIWFTSSRNVKFSPQIAEQYREILTQHAPKWLKKRGTIWKRISRRVTRSVGRKPPFKIDNLKEAEFKRHWSAVTRPGAPLFPFRDIKPFPNPHLRSNAFMIRRELLLDFDFKMDNTKAACNRFESAWDGLPTRLAQRGLSSILVGADGTAYEVADWPRSRTFRLGDQANVLVADNQVRAFAAMPEPQKALHVRMTWGDYLPDAAAGIIDFGVEFKRGSLDLAPAAAPAAAAKTRQNPLFSVVIPTHNRLALLRDAVYSITRQSGPNWECVIFDNSSEDAIAEYVSSLNDSRVRYERSEEFLPVTVSWNRAIDLAKGDYVTLIGDDDGLVPNGLIKLSDLTGKMYNPDVIYSSLYQFYHPGVAPWESAGYVVDLRNGFFFRDRSEPFLLDAHAAEEAVNGSLSLRRNFTFNMQAFTFARGFLDKVRIEGKVFHSPFPDYYLANMAMSVADSIAISPEPLAIAGVSRASFGFTLFNNLEERGAALLNAELCEDTLYQACEPMLLPGPAYNTNYIVTMEHVARKLGTRAPCAVDYRRYRRLQIYSVIAAQDELYWMIKSPGSFLWARMTAGEKLWSLYVGLVNWRAKNGRKPERKAIKRLAKKLEMYDFAPIVKNQVVGRFAHLSELFDALASGSYPEPAGPSHAPQQASPESVDA